MTADPTPPFGDGRDSRGRFAPGNSGGPGNPHAKRVGTLRAALLDAVTPEDIAAVTAALVEKARSGDVMAAREILDRCLGKAEAVDLLCRLDEMEGIFREVQSLLGGPGDQ
jgi:hypothetical protein